MQITDEMVDAAYDAHDGLFGIGPFRSRVRAALEAALGVCKELPAAEVIERVAKDQVSDPSTDDLSVPLALENVALASRIALRDACIEDLAAALKEVISVSDRATDIYDRARATLERWGLK